jgi:alpha-1,6-mannosyltransferase
VRSYLDKLLVAAERCGHELLVIAPGPRDEEQRVGKSARIVRYRAPRLPYDSTYHAPLALRTMRRLLEAHAPDVLQVSSPFIPAWVATSPRLPALYSYVHHSDPIGSYVNPIAERLPRRWREKFVNPAWAYLRAVCRRFDVTVVAGQWLERELKQRGCQRVETVPFGINRADFSPARRDEALRREVLGELSSDPRARLVVVAGRLAIDKRQKRLMKALLQLSATRPIGLLLLGDGPERAGLERLGGRLPAFRSLSFCKDRAEYARILASADVLLHGSVSETYGFVLAEALASGTPLVVPRAGGAGALAAAEYSETYEPEAGPDAIAVALERLLARPHATLSLAARDRAETIPTMDDHFTSLFALYAERLAQARHTSV